MQSQISEYASIEPISSFDPTSYRPSSHKNYLLIMKEGKAAGALPALEPPRIPSELQPAATRAKVRRWAARRIGWLR